MCEHPIPCQGNGHMIELENVIQKNTQNDCKIPESLFKLSEKVFPT